MYKKILFMIISGMIFSAATGQESNPFFTEWTTPFQVPPFGQIKLEHFMPAFNEGMKQQVAEINALTSKPEPPTFENTILAYDKSGELLEKVELVFYSLNSANTNPEMQNLAKKLSPITTKHSDDITLNPELFSRVKTVYDQREKLSLDPDQKRLVEETYKNFVRGGANLDSTHKARLRDLNKKINILQLTFGQNLLSETNAFRLVIQKKEKLAGLPQSAINIAAEAAKSDTSTVGKWTFTLQNSSIMPFLQYSSERPLRETILNAYVNRGNNNNDKDNKAIIAKLILFRLEKAKILGYPTFADFVLDDRMAKKPENVYKLLDQVWKPAILKAKEEATGLQGMMTRQNKAGKLEPWDWMYYSEKGMKQKFGMNEDTLRPYFLLDNVSEGAFYVANKLYGITFTEVKDAPKYFPDMTLWECKDEDGSLLGVLYLDFHPRASKRGGAWTTSFRHQGYKDGKRIPPVMSIICNFSSPTPDQPSLLSPDETETLFHEFGHALAGLFKNVKYNGFLSLPRDFVELPSQIMEHWVFEPEVMKVYAKHYKTGAVIPKDLVDKVVLSRKYGQGFKTTEYLAAAYLDMDFHTLKDAGNMNVLAFEQKSMEKIGLIPQIYPRYRSTYFQHSMTGSYTAGYYGYIWAEVLDADAYQAFRETGDIFNKTVATKFRKTILEKGNSKEAMDQYIDFRGSQPKIDALLENRGLK
jgi:peptidyl-dipeptidase Dcp